MEQKTFPAMTCELDNVLAMIESECEKLDVSMAAQMQLSVAVEELFVNVANYAYGTVKNDTGSIIPASQTDATKTCNVSVYREDKYIVVRLEDDGVPFDPFDKSDPDVTMKAEDRQVGGLGIFLVKKTMDEYEYRREDNRNIVVIKKAIA